MPDVEETRLPGVGIRHDFVTASGTRIGLLSHFSGRRELIVYDDRDPDAGRDVVELDEDDVHTLAEMLGADHITERLAGLQQTLRGMAIDWLPVAETASVATVAGPDGGLAGAAGVSIVAVVRDGETVPAPAADYVLRPGDTVVVVGRPEAIRQALRSLRGG